MRTPVAAVAALIILFSGPVRAADGWGIEGEQIVEIEAKVVDVACHIRGDCPANCGDGKRQLGLLTADGKLRLAVKGATNFAGAVRELLPHCGKTILADGLLITNPAMTIFMVQNLRLSKADKLAPATAFEAEWKKANGPAEEWFRADPLVKQVIEADGVFGIKGLVPKP